MMIPDVSNAMKLSPNVKRLFIGAYGFEDRSLGWTKHQKGQGTILSDALLIQYNQPKGENRIDPLRKAISKLGVRKPAEVSYDYGARFPGSVEESLGEKFSKHLGNIDEVILDISAMSKLLILISLCKLSSYTGTLRIVYCEAEDYAPTYQEYEKSRKEMEAIATFPSQGVESIVRTKCLSSIRMQGQPVTLITFTSFNEQLVRHMLGTISPHRLLFINGRPPRSDYAWRECATQEIHGRLINEFSSDNPVDEKTKLLTRVASTFDYRETIHCLKEIYQQFGIYERIICAATGSKMQTVGLFFSKVIYPDIHIEYPTPNSYFVKGFSTGIRGVYEVVLPRFSETLRRVKGKDR
jgi:hypothetical protein